MLISGCETFQIRPHAIVSIEDYIAYMDRLNEMDAKGLTEEHDKVSAAYAEDPGPGQQLYLALVLAQTDYPESDIESAYQHLSVLKNNEVFQPAVKQLVRINLARLEQQQAYLQIIEARERKIRELRSELDKIESRLNTQADTKQYLREELSEMESRVHELTDIERNLRRELDEVKDKLQALTDIEQELSKPD